MRDLFTQETYIDIFSYLNLYEITEIFIAIPEWDTLLPSYLPILQNQTAIQQQEDIQECQCHQSTTPLMGQMIRIIELSRFPLFEFYQKVFKKNRFDEFIFSWVILFADEAFFDIFWNKYHHFTTNLWRYYANSTHIVYGLELISYKMRNRLPIIDFYQFLHQLEQYCHGNQDIMYLYKNYHRVHRKNPLSLRYFQETKKQYAHWILQNLSFLFFYIEKYVDESDEL